MTRVGASPLCMCAIGKRGSGKSVMLRDIVYHLHLAGIPRACVLSATEGGEYSVEHECRFLTMCLQRYHRLMYSLCLYDYFMLRDQLTTFSVTSFLGSSFMI